MARRRMLRVFLFVCAFLLQANGLQNAQSSQNSGSIDLTGRWKTADRRQFNVEQNGQHVHATLVPGSDKCANGATLNYLFDGNLSGTSLDGKLTACTDEKLVKDCGLEKVWTTTFNATVGPSKISGKDFITGYMHGDENGHYVNCYADPQYDRYEDFTLVPCEQVVANPYWDDVT